MILKIIGGDKHWSLKTKQCSLEYLFKRHSGLEYS